MAAKDEGSDLLGKAAADIKKVEQGAEKLVKMVVALGRTVFHEGKNHKPGAPISLPASEADRLKAAGFVTDPAAPAPAPATEGPSVTAK